jgi:hypothetical protein
MSNSDAAREGKSNINIDVPNTWLRRRQQHNLETPAHPTARCCRLRASAAGCCAGCCCIGTRRAAGGCGCWRWGRPWRCCCATGCWSPTRSTAAGTRAPTGTWRTTSGPVSLRKCIWRFFGLFGLLSLCRLLLEFSSAAEALEPLL